MILRSANFALAILFLVFAWLQRNDLDPTTYHEPSTLDTALWLLFYLLIAALLVVVNFRRIPRWLLAIALLACLVEMARTGPGLYENLFGDRAFNLTQSGMSAEDPRVELSREFFGAVIALLGLGWVFLGNLRFHRSRSTVAAS